MNFSNFLEKDDRIKFGLLNRLTSEATSAVSAEYLYDKIDISSYKLEQTISEINNDLLEIDPTKHTFIDFSDKSIIRGINLKTSVLQKTGLMYIKNSVSFLVLEYLFFFNNQMTKNDYRDQNFISKTTFYKAEALVKQLLKEQNFYESSKITDDEEFTIRLQLFQLYYQIYNGIENPFSEIDEVINHLIDHLKEVFQIELKPTQVTKISIFARIWLLRLNNNNFISDSLLQPDKHYPFVAEFNQLMNRDLKTDLSTIEIDYFYAFLLSEGIIPGAESILSNKITPLTEKLTEAFINTVKNSSIFDSEINPAIIEPLADTIYSLNLQFFTFYHEPITFISIDQIKFFQQTYPLFHDVITTFYDNLHLNLDIKLSKNDKTNLYFSCMFALITTIPSESLRDKVYICVDFSQGALYSGYIKQTLKSFANAHIVIQNEANELTNIYLSDFQSNLVNVEQIIWQNPPSPTDWSILGDEIIRIKHKNIFLSK